jgi:hypothetical protein
VACNDFEKCEFIVKMGDEMPFTKDFIKRTYCVDRERCLKKKLARTMIENLFEGKFTEKKSQE